jgi:hypothetical protein
MNMFNTATINPDLKRQIMRWYEQCDLYSKDGIPLYVPETCPGLRRFVLTHCSACEFSFDEDGLCLTREAARFLYARSNEVPDPVETASVPPVATLAVEEERLIMTFEKPGEKTPSPAVALAANPRRRRRIWRVCDHDKVVALATLLASYSSDRSGERLRIARSLCERTELPLTKVTPKKRLELNQQFVFIRDASASPVHRARHRAHRTPSAFRLSQRPSPVSPAP